MGGYPCIFICLVDTFGGDLQFLHDGSRSVRFLAAGRTCLRRRVLGGGLCLQWLPNSNRVAESGIAVRLAASFLFTATAAPSHHTCQAFVLRPPI